MSQVTNANQGLFICNECNYQKQVNGVKLVKMVRRLHSKTCPRTGRKKEADKDNKAHLTIAYKKMHSVKKVKVDVQKHMDKNMLEHVSINNP